MPDCSPNRQQNGCKDHFRDVFSVRYAGLFSELLIVCMMRLCLRFSVRYAGLFSEQLSQAIRNMLFLVFSVRYAGLFSEP